MTLNNPQPPASPRLLLAYFRLFALLGIVPFLINTVDILLHLRAPSLDPTVDIGLRVLMGLLVAPLTLAIAVLCIRRAPGNLVGWLLVSFAYGTSVLVFRADSLPLQWALLIANLFVGQFWGAFLLIPLYFPNGRLYPPRINRWGNPLVSFLIFGSMVIANLSNSQLSWTGSTPPLTTPNPLLVFAWNYTAVTIPMIVAVLIAGIITVILRYRGSREQERLQLRWLLFGVLLQGVLTLGTVWIPSWNARLTTWVSSLYGLIIPVAVGIAVLRYRLYDIDLIIRRTLQYGLISVLLGLVYFGLVVLLGQAFQAVTGQASPLVVVISTLAIIVLFNPLRRRIQTLIDRRFFRAKYDASQVVTAFSSSVRGQVELDALARQLAATAQEALQPDGVWVWIRKENKRKDIRSGS